MEHSEKVSAVREFLREAYPVDRVEERYDSNRKACIFDIRGDAGSHRVIVEDGFMTRVDVAGIPTKLTEFTLIEHLRDLGATPIRVTGEGLELEYD